MYFIYVVENLVNGKLYVGQTFDPDKRKNAHFSLTSKCPLLVRAIRKYGTSCFDFTILESCPLQDEAHIKEKYWIEKLNTIAPFGYNLTTGGLGGKLAEEIELKRIEQLSGKGKPNSLSKMGPKNPMFGKKISKAARKAKKEAVLGKKNPFYGQKHTDETIQRLRLVHKKENLSEETLQKMRLAQLGKRLSDEHKKKISLAVSGNKNSNYGKSMAEETKRKLRRAKLGKKLSEEHKKKLSVAAREAWARRKVLS